MSMFLYRKHHCASGGCSPALRGRLEGGHSRAAGGPLGYKYVIKEVHASNLIPTQDQRMVRVFELMGNDNPLVVSCTDETYEGMEVRILKTADMPKGQ